MDNTRDVRRFGASRFSFAKRQSIKQSGFDGRTDEDSTIAHNSKKRVGVSGTATEEGEMGCVGSDGEELRPTTNNNNRKRFKLSKKFIDECNNVDHASVPRKLRSAMKKRSGGSVSPPLPDTRKVNHMVNGNVLPRKNGTKKSKLNMQNGEPERSPKQVITRDEEEVVETLFALAGMFSNNDKIDESTKFEVKSSTLPESSAPAVLKEEGDLQANNSSSLEGSTLETVKVQSVNESSQADLPASHKYPIELDNYVPQGSERPTCNSVGPVSKHDESSASERILDIATEPVPAYRSQCDLQPAITETKNSGSALWPGLSTTGSLDAQICGPPLQLCTAKLPAWLGNASISTQPCSSKNLVVTEKESRVEVGKRNSGKKKNEWKRCSAHVHISRLIKVLQITEEKDTLPVQQLNACDQLKTNEGSKKEAVLAANGNVVVHDKMSNSLNAVVSANNMAFSDVERSSNEVRNAILLHKRLLQDQNQKQVPTTSEPYTSQKQGFDFISISTGEYGAEGVSGNNRAGNGLESSTPFHVPCLHSIAQNHATMPLSLPQNHQYSSASFPNHFSAAAAQQVQVQLPPYLCSPFSGPSRMESSVLSEQQHQQLQRVWTAQQATQYRPGDVIDPTYLPSWQNGRQGCSPSLIQYGQAMFPPISYSSLEVLGPNYATTISPQQQQQQQQFISILAPPSWAKRQHHPPPGYEGNGAPAPIQITLQ